jgi:hypothetical protein
MRGAIMSNELELRVNALKKLKSNECGLIYDEKRGLLIAVCNKNGELKILRQRVEEL